MNERDREALASAVKKLRLDEGWSKEQAAREAGISSITWKRIEDGLPVRDVKRNAVEKLLGMDRANVEEAKGAAASVADRLNPALADFTDHELLWEIEGRLLLMASKLHAGGEQTLVWRPDPEWPGGILGSVPPRGGK